MCCRGGGGPTVQEISLKNTKFLCLPLGNMSFWQVQCLGTRTIEQCRFHAIESKHSNLFCSRYSNSKDSRGEASTLLFSLFSLLMQIATLCRSLTLCLIFNKVRGTLVRIATQSLCERDHSFQSLRLLVAEDFPTNIARIAKASLHRLWSVRHQFVTQLDDLSPLQWDLCIDQLEIILRTSLRQGWEVNGIEPN